MIRAIVLLAGFALANAGTASCAINGARAVDDLLDSATYIWASIQRCDKNSSQGNEILCSMDVSSAIESVNAMVNVVLKAVEDCGDLDGANAKCGLAVGVLTKSFAGVAAGSSGVDAKCTNNLNGNFAKLNYLVRHQGPNFGNANGALNNAAGVAAAGIQAASFGQCIVNVKDLTKSVFKASKRIVTVKQDCDGSSKKECAHNALKVIASFSAIGEYLAGAIGRCSANNANNSKMILEAECSAEVMDLISSVDRMSSAAVNMKRHCLEGETRLYELEHSEGSEQQGSNIMTIGLAALLPITAVFAFVGGSRFSKARGHVTVQEADLLIQE